ncbi:MAG: hypothetical protein CBB71_10780 [Rhodopirellula sp. TMED11]|nr:MAG: hypothetical protein CBB71_10780 [Rhodopirellula sp. TMED11]
MSSRSGSHGELGDARPDNGACSKAQTVAIKPNAAHASNAGSMRLMIRHASKQWLHDFLSLRG